MKSYHNHPHPQFVFNDQAICYATLVRNKMDVAFVRTADLIAATS
jgi:hypothetical protein